MRGFGVSPPCILVVSDILERGFFRSTDFSFYIFNEFDLPKMTKYKFTLFSTSMSNKIREVLVNLFMVEDAAGLNYIKDKVAKRTEEIIFHAEC